MNADASPPATRRFSAPPRLTIAVASIVVVLDQVTKHWAVNSLAGEAPRHVIWTLQWNLTYNTGMAFSSGTGIGPLIGVVAIAVAVAVLVSIRRVPSTAARVAGGLIVGGALGNVLDRLFRDEGWLRGAVVDFVDFQWFPIFNVADMAVNVGGALFLLWSFFGQHPVAPAGGGR